MKRSRYILSVIVVVISTAFPIFARSSRTTLAQKIHTVIDTSRATIGVGVLGLDFRDSLVINNDHHYPMQSVFKFPLALTILHLVDQHKLSVDDLVDIRKESLDRHTWSPLATMFPDQDISITLRELLDYTIAKSDNNTCDILFGKAGGTAPVNKYIHKLGVKNISIAATEAEMKKGWQVQYTNWCRPDAMLQLLSAFYKGRILSRQSTALLTKMMTESANSDKRLKGLIPWDAEVAHKTGTSNTSDAGLTAATNDVGIITLPDGRHYAIVVFVSDYKGGVPRGERLIAEISRIVWLHYGGSD